MSYSIIIDKDRDFNDSASEVSGFTGSVTGDDERYLSDGVLKLRDLAEAGYISDSEEQRRKELIEQFFEYQSEIKDFADEPVNSNYLAVRMFFKCWRGLIEALRMS